MVSQFVNLKDWRQNMHTYWKKAKGKDIRFIVLKHSKPMFEVKIIVEDDPEIFQRGKPVGKSFNFWADDADDGIFDETIRL
jgi:hypothetical protein